MQDKAGETNTLYKDCNVIGKEATELVSENIDTINDLNIKVSARYVASDLYLDGFLYEEKHTAVKQGKKKAGEPGLSLKGRLLKLSAMKFAVKTVVSKSSLVPGQYT
ncbi:MAG: DUF3577 domain-containing protein [Psychromonas sp.]|nr:DUF3577 domain-containing protein [Psychromonas sp.]